MVSTQHVDYVDLQQIRTDVIEHIIKPTIPAHMLDSKTNIYINPIGRFVTGGPMGDAGLTGRKIIVDTYGGMARHGAYTGRFFRPPGWLSSFAADGSPGVYAVSPAAVVALCAVSVALPQGKDGPQETGGATTLARRQLGATTLPATR